ncbi:hypothetical protein [Streptomyces sp. NPDC018031]|uniref:hypothetical protein n=1 Tax=Streptomyces sp. NPDC018031 TaxID=3365033 RepID=UPI0037909C0A
MTEPHAFPPPPQRPPTIGRTTWWTNQPAEPRVVIVTADPPAAEAPGRRFLPDGWRWRPLAALAATGPGTWWAQQLADPELSTGGAMVLCGLTITISAALDLARGQWLTRVALYSAVLGTALALPARPVLTVITYLITGVS